MKKLTDKQQAKLDAVKTKQRSFFKEFGEFINRGSVLDLAIGVIVGGAFTTIVTSLVNDIIMPVISLLLGGFDFTNLKLTIPNFFGADTGATIAYGNFIQNVVNFLLTAFCVFLVVRAINRIREKADRKTQKKDAEKKKQDDGQTQLLKEIRDLLKNS